MAKKGNRVQVILECTEHKESGMPGTSRYVTQKNKKNTPDRLELKKLVPINTLLSSTRGLPCDLGKKGASLAICSPVSQ